MGTMKQGVTLLEMILVLVIIDVGGSLVLPSLVMGVENRQTKQAVETIKAISHAARLYEQDVGAQPTGITDLELYDAAANPQGKGYLKPQDYAHRWVCGQSGEGFTYLFSRNAVTPDQWHVEALRVTRNTNGQDPCSTNTTRFITYTNGVGFSDSKGLYTTV